MIAAKKLFSICLLAAALCALGASAAQAAFSIDEFDGKITKEGLDATQAGDRADLTFDLRFPAATNAQGNEIPAENVKKVVVDLPRGMVGNPAAIPTCPEASLLVHPLAGSYFGSCPPETIVGLATVHTSAGADIALPVANLQAAPGTTAQFGFNFYGAVVKVSAIVREGGRKLASVVEAPQSAPLYGSTFTFWGVPADESHDSERGGTFGLCGEGVASPCESEAPRVPFMSNSTNCAAGPLTSTATANTWQHPDDYVGASFHTHLLDGTPSGVTGCEALQFEPTMSVKPTSSEAGAPTGLDIELKMPSNEDPDGFAVAHLKKTVTTLPAGMTVNASQANGVAGCSEAQFGLLNEKTVTCPDASKIGSAELITPLLTEPLEGSVYLAQQGTNPFNSLLALYVVAANPERGVAIKLAGEVKPDPKTGQLTTTFDDNPQQPFSRLSLHLDAGDRAGLVNPPTCGTYTTHADIYSWAMQGVAVPADSSFTLDRGCGRASQFTPGFEAGTASPLAGTASAFSLKVTRPDGQPNLAAIQTTLPEGLLAKLAGVGICPDSAAPSGNCPASSQVGSATVGAGSGANPVFVPQPGKAPTAVYLAGPHKGAPYSLVAKVPAQAGPFDLGTVAVRNAIEIDPESAQVTVTSDPLPQFLQGVPVSYREVRVDVDRPGFTLNPTDCEAMAVDGVLGSAAGGEAKVSNRFQVANCANLGFAPKLALSLKGGTKRSEYPALKAVLTAKPGQANIGRVSVALPHSEFLAQNHIKTICTRVQYAADQCPKGSIYGHARAFTPLLDEPLEGPVYLRSSSNPLPDLVMALHGAIDIDLVGRIDSVRGGIRNTFETVPDAPVSKFVLTMKGGKKSLLENSRNLCATTAKATVQMDGQNGKVADSTPILANQCAKKKRKAGAKGAKGKPGGR